MGDLEKRELDIGKVLACHQVHSHSGQNPIVESDQSWPEYNPSKVAERAPSQNGFMHRV